MGLLSDVLKAMDDYGRKHKEHMTSQWEKQAERAKAAEPRPLTETQKVWQSLVRERELQQGRQRPQPVRQQLPASSQHHQAAAAAAPQLVPATPVYTVTWKVRVSGLGNIPLPWATTTTN